MIGAVVNNLPLTFSTWLQRNQVANRALVKLAGHDIGVIVFARNKYERYERYFDQGVWMVMALALPLLCDRIFNGFFSKHVLKKQFGLTATKPLAVSWTLLDRTVLKQPQRLAQLAQEVGADLARVNVPRLINKLKLGKLLILGSDLVLMSSKVLVGYWGRNLFTEKVSKKQGFSGTFNDATDEYRTQKNAFYQKNKKRMQWITSAASYGSAILLPLLIALTLRHAGSAKPNAFIHKAKSLVKAFDYTDAIYMSKWTLLWFSLWSANLTSILSARDSHERREKIVRSVLFDFFFYIGDEVLNGLGAMGMTWYARRAGKRLETPILARKTLMGIKNLPIPINLFEVYKAVQGNKNALAYKYARNIYWTGLAGTSFLLSVALTLANNWYTHKKVLKEQAKMGFTKPSVTISPAQRKPVGGPPAQLYPPVCYTLSPAPAPMPFAWQIVQPALNGVRLSPIGFNPAFVTDLSRFQPVPGYPRPASS